MTVNRTSHERTDDSTLQLVPEGVTIIRTPSPEPAGRIHSFARQRKAPGTMTETPGGGGGDGRRAGKTERLRSAVYNVLKTPVRWIYRILCYPDMQIGWIPVVAYRTWKWVRDHPDTVVFSSTPPHSTQLGVRIARVFRRFRWVVDFRDPWTSPLRKPKGKINLGAQRAMERWVLDKADQIVVNTPGNREALVNAFPGVPKSKLSAVTNAFDDDEPVVSPDPADPMLACDIAYFGELYPDMLSVYLDAVIELNRRGSPVPRLHVFGIVGEGDVARVKEAGMEDKIVFQGTVPYARSISLMRGARSLLLLLPDQARWATCVPSKLYAYLFTGRPILAVAPPGDAARIVTETGSGVALPPGDSTAIAEAIELFVSSLGRGERTLGGLGNEEALAPYSMRSIAGQIDEILGRSE
jgi:glycosyltransferase involved in cell wall biosynthesis